MTAPIYRLALPGLPPRANARLVPVVVAGKPALRHRRDAGVDRWQGDAKVAALVQLRQQGLWAPLTGRVCVVVVWTVQRPRDVDSSIKDTLDALTGAAWVDDRQVGPLACMVRVVGSGQVTGEKDDEDPDLRPLGGHPLRGAPRAPGVGAAQRRHHGAVPERDGHGSPGAGSVPRPSGGGAGLLGAPARAPDARDGDAGRPGVPGTVIWVTEDRGEWLRVCGEVCREG